MPQPMSRGRAHSETSRRSLRTSTYEQRSHIASAVRVKSEPAEALSVSMSKEEQSEQKVMAGLALAVEGDETDQKRAVARRGKRARDMQSAPVQIKQEHNENSTQPGGREETDGSKGTTGRSKARKAPKMPAPKAEQHNDTGVPVEPKKRRKVAQSPQEPQATAAEDTSEAKPKQRRQRRPKADQPCTEQMPDMPEAKQEARRAAAAVPKRRKAAERADAGRHPPLRQLAAQGLRYNLISSKRSIHVLAGADTGDILDGEVAVAELVEADIEEEIELVDITRVVPPGKLIGAHVSMSNGIARAVINAASIGTHCSHAPTHMHTAL